MEIKDKVTSEISELKTSKPAASPASTPNSSAFFYFTLNKLFLLETVDASRISGGTTWIGDFINDNKTKSISLQVGIRRGKTFDGTMTWIESGAKTKVQGIIILDILK